MQSATSSKKSPRLLVVDDDLGVIAAYRLVLEKLPDDRATQSLFGLDAVEAELFGTRSDGDASMSWRVEFVDQGLDAIHAIDAAKQAGDPFTAMFLDVRMPPGLDGYEVAQRVRMIDPNLHIVIVTGYSDYTVEEFVEVAGPESRLTYMQKPVWPDQLRQVARILTGQKPSLTSAA